MTEIEKQNVKICFLATAAFSLAANSFGYFNLIPHHDGVTHMLQFASKWEISLGRFLLPIWGNIVEDLYVPWFNGMLSILFLSVSVWFCTEILNIRSKTGIILTAGFLSINYSIAELCATFGYVLGVIGEYIAKTYMETKNRPHYIVADSNIDDIRKIR